MPGLMRKRCVSKIHPSKIAKIKRCELINVFEFIGDCVSLSARDCKSDYMRKRATETIKCSKLEILYLIAMHLCSKKTLYKSNYSNRIF